MLFLLLLPHLLGWAAASPSLLPARRIARRVPSNPFDHTWITEWAAVGDSFTSSVGSGKCIHYWCSRYDQGYPNVINDDESMRNNSRLNYLGCLGHTLGDIRTKQVDTLSAQQDMITLTGGGSDVNFDRMMQICVYNWVTLQGYQTCEEAIEKATSTVESQRFTQDMTDLVEAAKSKLSPDLRGKVAKVFWILYVDYFDVETSTCDGVTWSFKSQSKPPYLTQAYRKRLNDLVDMVNKKIKEIAAKAGPDVVVVDWQNGLDGIEGRYCWPGTDETLGKGDDREMLGLYEWYSTLDDDMFGNSRSMANSTKPMSFNTSNSDLPITKVPGNRMGPYQARLASDIAGALRNGSISFPGYNNGNAGLRRGDNPTQVASWLSDKILRTFHPQSNAHVLIANAVMEALEDVQANALKPGSHATSLTYGHCTASTTLEALSGQSQGTRIACIRRQLYLTPFSEH